MLNIIWLILIIYLFIFGIQLSKKINYKNLKINKIIKNLNKDSLYLSLGTKMGVGTIIGTTSSIYIGGPGSIIWIYLFTILTSSIIYIESYLGSKYKQKTKDGYISGIYYYTKYGLKNKFLAIITLILFISTYSFFFLMIQTNTINEISNINPYIISIIILILLTIILTNNNNQITNILNKIVPLMCIFFISISLYTIIKHINIIPNIIKNIIKNACNTKALLTGMVIGIKRSIFLNELLIGTTSMSSGINDTDPETTAGTLTIGSYFITFIMSTLISLLILIFLENNTILNITYNELLKLVFTYHFKSFGLYFLTILISLLATTTIISGIYIGISNLDYILKNKKITNIYKIIIIFTIISGIFINTNKIWIIIDTSMLLLIIINTFIIKKLCKTTI